MVKPLTTDPKVWKSLVVVFLLLTLFWGLFFWFHLISIPFVIGLVMVIITQRLLLSYRMKGHHRKRKWEKALMFVGIFLFWSLLIYFFWGYAQSEFESISADFQHLQTTEFQSPIQDSVLTMIQENPFLSSLIPTSSFTELQHDYPHLIINMVIIIPLLFAFAFGKATQVKNYIRHLVPSAYKHTYEMVTHDIKRDLDHYFMYKLKTANYFAVLSALGFYIIGLKGAFILGIMVGAFTIIPHIGIVLATVVALTIAQVQSPLNYGGDFLFTFPIDYQARMIMVVLIQLGLFLWYQFSIKKYFLKPRVHLDALLEIFLILAAFQFLGIMGMFFIIPIFIIYRIVLKEVYKVMAGN